MSRPQRRFFSLPRRRFEASRRFSAADLMSLWTFLSSIAVSITLPFFDNRS